MYSPESVAEQLQFATVRVEVDAQSGDTRMGTAFFFNASPGNEPTPVLVTNKHVIVDGRILRLRLHSTPGGVLGQPSGISHNCAVPLERDLVVQHPDESVDLCAVFVGPLLNRMISEDHVTPFFKTLTRQLVPSSDSLDELDAVEDVLMVGYPIGLWDQTNNLPIIRHGISATHPAYDFSGKGQFLVDCACFPGSSGSPVMLIRKGYQLGKTGGMLIGGTRVMFLGVLSAYYTMTTEGEIVAKDIPTSTRTIAQIPVPVSLGIVIKSRQVLTLADHAMSIANH